MVWGALTSVVPFYAGLSLEEIGGRGVRWPARSQASAMPPADSRPAPGQAATPSNGSETVDGLKLGTYRPIWAAPEVEVSPALHYTIARQQLEISPEDAGRLGIGPGDPVTISQNGTRLRGVAHVRSGVPAGTAFLAEGLAEDSANALTGPVVEVHKR
jgi:NADH-quinone oxidoreductase subunit G